MTAGDNDARCRHACPRRARRDRDRAGAVCGTGGITIASHGLTTPVGRARPTPGRPAGRTPLVSTLPRTSAASARASDDGRARRFGPAYPFGTGTQAHRPGRARPPGRYARRAACTSAGSCRAKEVGMLPAMSVSTINTFSALAVYLAGPTM